MLKIKMTADDGERVYHVTFKEDDVEVFREPGPQFNFMLRVTDPQEIKEVLEAALNECHIMLKKSVVHIQDAVFEAAELKGEHWQLTVTKEAMSECSQHSLQVVHAIDACGGCPDCKGIPAEHIAEAFQ